MHLTVIGSGDAFNAGGRGHACYWLDGATRDGLGLMVDFGPTALMNLRRWGRATPELGGVVFTHLHGDHIGGWPFLFLDLVMGGPRPARFEVLGPVGTAARLDALLRLCYGGLADQERGFELATRELAPGEAVELGGARIEAFAADHQAPPEQPLCLRITGASGRRAAFSGDTRPCPGLGQAARGTDLLVAECSGLRPPLGRHTTWEDWERELPGCPAGRVMLTHLGRDVRAATGALRSPPGGPPLLFAEDGLRLAV